METLPCGPPPKEASERRTLTQGPNVTYRETKTAKFRLWDFECLRTKERCYDYVIEVAISRT